MMIRLTCPSCNGDLELPDNLNVAHCLYCGTKILLDENIKNNSIKQYKEIILTALLAGNNNEVIEYCNKVLEFDSRNVDAWLDKANAIYNGTTETDDKFDEALIYLRKAYSIAPDNQRVFKVSRI